VNFYQFDGEAKTTISTSNLCDIFVKLKPKEEKQKLLFRITDFRLEEFCKTQACFEEQW